MPLSMKGLIICFEIEPCGDLAAGVTGVWIEFMSTVATHRAELTKARGDHLIVRYLAQALT
jgi:hypothetical protein